MASGMEYSLAMKAAVALFLFFLMPCAVAADFRALNYGDDCSDLEAKESLLGGVPVDDRDRSPFIVFQGEYQGRAVHIAYTCPYGKFSAGSYLFEPTSFEVGKQMYAEIKRHLSKEFGPPFFDEDSDELRAKLSEEVRKLSEDQRYSAVWSSGNSNIFGGLSGPGGGWRVTISYRPKDK
jgi:hypothetical protein